MRTSSKILATVALLPAVAAGMITDDFQPPLGIPYHTDFDVAAAVPEKWQIDSGLWSVSGGTLNSNGTAPAVATINDYTFNPIEAPQEVIGAHYNFRARVRTQGTGAASLAGVVFDYVDAANYSEAVYSATGTYVVRQVSNGTATTLETGTFSGGTNVWFDVEVIRTELNVRVRTNGVGRAAINVGPGPQFGGRLGLTSRNATARFDKVSIGLSFGGQPFKDDFTNPDPQWDPIEGAWSAGNGMLTSISVQQNSLIRNGNLDISLQANSNTAYLMRARMLNPYGGAGNLVGLYGLDGPCCEDGSQGRVELLFSPRGQARIDLIHNGITETIATAPYPGRRNEWFDVRANVSAGAITVAVNGTTIFDRVGTSMVLEGGGGLITHWAPGKFDDVWFDNRATFLPLSVPFDSAPPADWIVSGTWNTSSGTLNDTSAGISDIVTTNCGCWETDFSYRARLLNQYAGSGNLVGLVYNYQRQSFSENSSATYAGLYNGDYYEVVFAPTGQAFINKVINGVRYRQATGTHTVPRNVSFDVEVLRQDRSTTVKVNGVTVFERVPQGELPFGDVGVVSHWSKAKFDNLTVSDPPR